MVDEEKLIERAIDAYYKRNKKLGYTPTHPDQFACEIKRNHVFLKKCYFPSTYELLAIYEYNEKTDRLKWVEVKEVK